MKGKRNVQALLPVVGLAWMLAVASGSHGQEPSHPGHHYCHYGQGFSVGATAYNECVTLYYRGAFQSQAPAPQAREKRSLFDELRDQRRREAIDNLTPGRTSCRKIGNQVFCEQRD